MYATSIILKVSSTITNDHSSVQLLVENMRNNDDENDDADSPVLLFKQQNVE